MIALPLTVNDEMSKLGQWVDGVRAIPRFLRTREARAVFDALAEIGVKGSADLAGPLSLTRGAGWIGRTEDELKQVLGKCPFGF